MHRETLQELFLALQRSKDLITVYEHFSLHLEQPETEIKKTISSSSSSSSVETILNSLSQLEKDLDTLSGSIEDIKKKFNAYADEEIENLKTRLAEMASEAAKRVIDQAKQEADGEASKIIAEGENALSSIKKKIDSTFDKAVDTIVKKTLAA